MKIRGECSYLNGVFRPQVTLAPYRERERHLRRWSVGMALLAALALWPRVSTHRFQLILIGSAQLWLLSSVALPLRGGTQPFAGAFLLSLAGRDPPDARGAAQRIVQAVREVRVPGLPPVTVSAGLALASEVRSVPERRALTDGRLYAARTASRDRLMDRTRTAS